MWRDLKRLRPSMISGLTMVAFVVIAKLSSGAAAGANSRRKWRQWGNSSGSPPPAIRRTKLGTNALISSKASQRVHCRSREAFCQQCRQARLHLCDAVTDTMVGLAINSVAPRAISSFNTLTFVAYGVLE